MIPALRGHAPQASSIRHAKRLLSPSTSRRYRRFNCQPLFFRRLYSTENEHAAPLETGSAPSTDVQPEVPGHSVTREGFGDKNEDAQEDVRPAHQGKENSAAPKTENEHAPLETGSAAPTTTQPEGQKYTVTRGGFGDEDEDAQEYVRPARKAKKTSAAPKTENEHAPLETGSAAPTTTQPEGQKYTVTRGGFGDEDEDAQEYVRPARKAKKTSAAPNSQWQRLRKVEPAVTTTATPGNTRREPEQYEKDPLSFVSDPWLSTLEDEHGEPTAAPENTFKRTTQEDLVSLSTTTPWELHRRYGFLERGFEFDSFLSARSFIIEAMQLKDSLNAHLSLSNFGRLVYMRLGNGEKDNARWSLSDEDVDLAWALQSAAKKYLGKRQIDASARPMGDLGFSDSWSKTSRLLVPTSTRWHHILDLRKPPMAWLTMEYRPLSQLGLNPIEACEALVNQITDDVLKQKNGEEDMAFPVWCVTDHTLAVSQTEFFRTLASISKPGDGRLQFRETVILHRTFNLEQFNAMVKRESQSLKSVNDAGPVGVLLKSVTKRWNLSTVERDTQPGSGNDSAVEVYLKGWRQFLTRELRPMVYRILVKELPEHTQHIEALPEMYTREAVIRSLETRSGAGEEIVPDAAKMRLKNAALNQQRGELGLKSQHASKQRGFRTPNGFGTLVSMLRERLEEDSRDLHQGRGPDDVTSLLPAVQSAAWGVKKDAGPKDTIVRADPPGIGENSRWKGKYHWLVDLVQKKQQIEQSHQGWESSQDGSSVNTELAGLLSRVGNRNEVIDWETRYHELLQCAKSLGLMSKQRTVHWKPDTGFSKRKNERIHVSRQSAPDKGWKTKQDNHPLPQLDEAQYVDMLQNYTENRRERSNDILYYHWLPGEKLNLNDPAAVEANTEQTWRPTSFKKYFMQKAIARYRDPLSTGMPDSLVDAPGLEKQDRRPPFTTWGSGRPYARPLDAQGWCLHWQPGEQLHRDEDGHIRAPTQEEKVGQENELMKKEARHDDDRLTPPPASDAMRLESSSSPSGSFDGEAERRPDNVEYVMGYYTKHFMPPGPNLAWDAKTQPVQEQRHAETETEAEAVSEQQPREQLSSAENDPANVGFLNDAEAEKLLHEVGISTEEGKESAFAEGECVSDKKDGEVEAGTKREGVEEGHKSEEIKDKRDGEAETEAKSEGDEGRESEETEGKKKKEEKSILGRVLEMFR
ncbi:hypothetical protein IWX91DRAFT_385548 [Phyllosticta citricarpa]